MHFSHGNNIEDEGEIHPSFDYNLSLRLQARMKKIKFLKNRRKTFRNHIWGPAFERDNIISIFKNNS